ncbi:MAG TPA: hypothetical protein VF506_17200 [Streptosporangiaceae bacterium]
MALIQRPRDGSLLVSEGSNPSGELFEIAEQLIRDARKGTRVIWRPLAADDPPLYPDGVGELIRSASWQL